MSLRMVALGLGALAAFMAGWQVNGWRIEQRVLRQDLARESAVREAMTANAKHVAAANAATQDRESTLLVDLETERQRARELRNEIEQRPVIRQVVKVPVANAAGELVCPPVPTVAWGVFEQLYNAAATGEAAGARRRDAGVPADAAGVDAGPRATVGDRP